MSLLNCLRLAFEQLDSQDLCYALLFRFKSAQTASIAFFQKVYKVDELTVVVTVEADARSLLLVGGQRSARTFS